MIEFCPPGDSYEVAWVNNGFSRCFLDTASSVVSSAFLLLAGLSELVLCKPKTDKNSPVRLSRAPWMIVVIVLCLIQCITFPFDALIKGVVNGNRLTGVYILKDILGVVSWLFAVAMLLAYRWSILKRGVPGVVVTLFWCMSAVWLNLCVVSWNNPQWWWGVRGGGDAADLVVFCLQYILVVCVVVSGVVYPCLRRTFWSAKWRRRRRGRMSYRIQIDEADAELDEIDPEETVKETKVVEGGIEKASGSTFSDIWKKTRILFPYVWPKRKPLLQLRVVFCFILLAGGRVVNVFVPIYYKYIVNALSTPSNISEGISVSMEPFGGSSNQYIALPWQLLLMYIFLRFLQGGGTGMGFLNNARQFLWIPIQQFTSRAIQIQVFAHLHSLSLRWHLGRKTGEVLRAMDRGTTSVTSLLNYILFNIIPAFADLGVAVVYFIIAFDIWFGLIVFTTMIAYILVTIGISEWRTKYRRDMNLLDNEARTKAVDSLLNFETVKYYGAEGFEVNRLNQAIVSYQSVQWKQIASLSIISTTQNVVIIASLLIGCFLCAYRVTQGVLNVGDFVLFVTYLIQLYAPLSWFGTLYTTIQQSFIDMENMFDLMSIVPEVVDQEAATQLTVSKGRVEFRDVTFSYQPDRVILKNINFVVEPGKTLALVGPSGAGKSTIIRLLFRFYDVEMGEILIDGENILNLKQASLRSHIGVVPQDTVLFNEDIRYNIRYGRPGATDEEVERAAEYADIHSRILNFPQQYLTKVGERGLKVSGGEKQRVAIARTILKSPEIILLDEATSALDTKTERTIQSALMEVCTGRTTIIVAHRLSTVVHADQILVLKEGEVVERGTHQELLAMGGVFCSMWEEQQRGLGEGDESEDLEAKLE